MTLTRTRFYILLIATFLALSLLYEAPWLFSKTTPGQFRSFGYGAFKNRMTVRKIFVDYTVNQTTYSQSFAYAGTYGVTPDSPAAIPIRYLTFAPSISRKDTLTQNWGIPLTFFAITFLITTIVFAQDAIIPFTGRFQLNKHRPFIVITR